MVLYHILYPLSEVYSVLNIFRYITFRSIYAIITGLVIAMLLGPRFIRYLRKKEIGEKIRTDGPSTHVIKAGTPTMGGLLIMVSIVLPVLLWIDLANIYIWIMLLTLILYGALGFYDDWLKLKNRSHGISAKKKLLYQFISALIIVSAIYIANWSDTSAVTTLSIPFFKDVHPDIGIIYFPFAVLVIMSASNFVNLTDGLDGLAIGPVIIAFSAYLLICYVSGHAKFAEYLAIPNIKQLGEVTIFCAAVVGASLGFLWFNCHPASVFMGNVGSTALGGLLGVVAVMSKQEFMLVSVGGVFVVEGVSVMLQVGWYKLTKKRLFLMAPLHHHFEKLGWPESKVIVRFWIVSLLLALISISLLKIR